MTSFISFIIAACVLFMSVTEAFRSMPTSSRATRSTLSMANKFAGGIPGSSAPLKDFDPLSFMEGKEINEIKKFQESELKHGRLCMLASTGLLLSEVFHPLFGGQIEGPAIYAFQKVVEINGPVPYFIVPTILAIGGLELFSVARYWESPAETRSERTAFLKPDATPGDLGFDPLGLMKGKTEAEFNAMRTKELNNGRLAIIATAGIVAQELVTGMPILPGLLA
ncbi:chlorophyll a/b-binding protein [Ochromonadaceae sp. CCMP2298]|nr:chlorophyll a/b-binding protein [Ochromonadaceae sp. CCMP2298]|eukprot:CAMPEP_0173194648 /NCGR_PEP_ID=MMETSP1141-20130122/14621_1 /TAXON_ID=483371 /ORGANISM="non described non described, Strain CCMP2298" /LENGTH=223 /DNA_ID=CAMNT_0014119099 /DNA_START=64 /DNA_END=735 /DNA_ORIENTATION=+